MNTRIMIFESDLKGHRLEYLHHLYCYFSKACLTNVTCTFVVPNGFDPKKGGLLWNKSSGVNIVLMTEGESLECSSSGLSGYYLKSRIMRKYVKKTESTHVFLISLMSLLPAILLGGGRSIGGASLSGIIYSIYTRNHRGKWYRIRSSLLFFIMTRLPALTSLFLLNDRASPRLFNKEFKSLKFKYLPDPYVPLSGRLSMDENILPKDENVITFLHFGGLTARKGTLEILHAALALISRPDAPQCRFVFAGKIYADIRDEFYRLVGEINDKIDIKVYDEFCEYEFLGKLCQESNCLLMPYKNVGQSSGLLGFAAQFGIPVIAPSSGLLGKIVKSYELGYTIPNTDAANITDSICEHRDEIMFWSREPNDSYLKENSVDLFCQVIESSFAPHA